MSEEQKKFITHSPKLNFFIGLILGVAVIAGIGFTGLIFTRQNVDNLANQQNNTNQQAAGEQEPEQKEVDLKINENDHVLGNKNAQVQIFTFSDFQCPYCARHHDTMHQIVDEYKDKVVWIFKQFPIASHPLGMPGAIAAECAAEQGKFWEMSDKIFENQTALSEETFEQFAKELGLDLEKFNSCFSEEKPKDKILGDYNLGIESGVGGTPSNFINNQMVPGAVPYENIKEMIDKLLK